MWFFPRRAPADGDVVDIDEINDNYQTLHNFIDAGLGRHNFEEGAFGSGALLPAGSLWNWYHTTNEVDWTFSTAPTSVPTNYFLITGREAWQPVTTLKKTFTSSGGLYYVVCSFLQDGESDQLSGSSLPTNDSSGAFYGLALDGNIFPDTNMSSNERSQDREDPVTGSSFTNTGTAIFGNFRSAVIRTLMFVPEGEHTIQLYAMQPSSNTTSKAIMVGQGELIILGLN